MSAEDANLWRKVRTPQGGILPNGKAQQCAASSTEINRQRSPISKLGFLCRCETSALSVGDALVRVKWWCKRPPALMATSVARKALSGAMPNREAQRCPRHYASG